MVVFHDLAMQSQAGLVVIQRHLEGSREDVGYKVPWRCALAEKQSAHCDGGSSSGGRTEWSPHVESPWFIIEEQYYYECTVISIF